MHKPNLTFSEPILLEDYIAVTVLPDWHEYVADIKEAETYFIDNELTTCDTFTNVNSKFHSPYRSQQHTSKFDALHGAILKEMNFAQDQFRGIKKTSLWDYLKVGECWIAKYEEGDTTHQHVHYPYHLISTFYYDVEQSTPIQFEYYEPHIAQKQIEVSNGMLVITSGSIKHSVPPCKGRRSVVASNWFYDISNFLEKNTFSGK